MEVVDEDYREDYRRTKGYVGKSILVLVLTLALLFVIYKYYIDNVENEWVKNFFFFTLLVLDIQGLLTL